MEKIECPYCEHTQNVDHEAGYDYGDDEFYYDCEECGCTFRCTVDIHISYNVMKADCLNGKAEHDFQLTPTFPREFARMRCSGCGEERELTDDERKKLGIGTKKEYMDYLKNK
jgi:transposase-like protein